MLAAALLIALTLPSVAHAADPVAPAPAAVRQADKILDPTARGVISYAGTVNVASFQQDGLMTHGIFEYVVWYRADKRVAISRRTLPNGTWKSLELDPFLDVDDSHDTMSMGVSPTDGRLHIAIGTHHGGIRYFRSVPGLMDDNSTVAWARSAFEPEVNVLPGASDAPASWTYPQFETVGGKLMLTYRDGTTGNGRNVLLRYEDGGTWKYLGKYTASEGSYTSPFGTSTSRYAYLHGFAANPVTGNLEISWSWREAESAWCDSDGLGNHDVGYAWSSDGGLTWKNNAGTQIATTGSSDMISIDDDATVVPISINRGLINQEAQAFDREGRVHVVTSQFNDSDLAKLGGCHSSTFSQRAQYARPHHYWRTADGTWRAIDPPFYSKSSGRVKLLFDRNDTAYMVLPDGRIAAATAATEWTDWKIVFMASDVDNIAELIVDRQRLERDDVLTVAYQETSSNNAPSAFRVADFSVDPLAQAKPKSSAPEAFDSPHEVIESDSEVRAAKTTIKSGDQLRVRFYVTADGIVPGGKVRVIYRGRVVRTVTLKDGTAGAVFRPSVRGRHLLTMRYLGTTGVRPSSDSIHVRVR